MKVNKYILLSLMALTFVSCFEDESTDATNPIAEIIIDESGLEKVYNIQKNELLVIQPEVHQTNKELPRSYAWEVLVAQGIPHFCRLFFVPSAQAVLPPCSMRRRQNTSLPIWAFHCRIGCSKRVFLSSTSLTPLV